MTLKEIEEALFPCTYKTRNGELVEITGFAFEGHLVNNPTRFYVWDAQMNYFRPSEIQTNDTRQFDLIELVKSPTMDKNHKKNLELIDSVVVKP